MADDDEGMSNLLKKLKEYGIKVKEPELTRTEIGLLDRVTLSKKIVERHLSRWKDVNSLTKERLSRVAKTLVDLEEAVLSDNSHLRIVNVANVIVDSVDIICIQLCSLRTQSKTQR